MVREALVAYLVEGVDAPPNFSVVIADDGGKPGVASGLHFLYRNHNAIIRTRRPIRVIEGLFAYLAGHLPAAEPNGLVQVPGVGLVKEGRAVVAPGVVNAWSETLSPRLNRNGVQFVDAPRVTLDVGRGDLVVEEPDLRIDRTALAELDNRTSPGREPARVEPGRYPLVSWAVFTGAEAPIGPLSTAQGIMAAAPDLMKHTDLGPEQVMEALGQLFVTARPMAVGSPYEGDLASKLLEAFST